MNSVLQCLFRSNSFLDFLHQVPHSPNSLSILLLELLNTMIKSKTASPKMFFKEFKVIRPQFAGGNQEDCQEFLNSLLQSLDDEISPNAQLKNMFGVTVISTLTCKSCSNQSSSVENTWCASLSIVKMEGGSLSNLEECISEFEKEEILEGENMWFCSFCKEKKKASKQLSLQVNGRYLFIHLKRFLVELRKTNFI